MNFTKITVINCQNKENIGAYLRRNDVSYRYLEKLKKESGNIKLNGKCVTAKQLIKNGDTIEIKNNVQEKSEIRPCTIPLDVIFEDEYILVVNKPSGLATMPTKSVYDNNLAGAIMHYMQNKDKNFVCRIINRLDKEVSGLVLIAKNSYAASFFNAHKNSIDKTYHAIACGKIDEKITINKPICTLKDSNGVNVLKRVVDPNGLSATTFVFPLKYLKSCDATLLEVKIVSGRTHQIRLHLSSIGHALIGDTLYGKESSHISRVGLMCKKMTILHPQTKQNVAFEIPYPADFKRVLVGDQV